MKVECTCGRVITLDEGDEEDDRIDRVFGSLRALDQRLAMLEAAEAKVTPIEDLVERHRRLVEYVLWNDFSRNLITEAEVKEHRAKLNVGG